VRGGTHVLTQLQFLSQAITHHSSPLIQARQAAGNHRWQATRCVGFPSAEEGTLLRYKEVNEVK